MATPSLLGTPTEINNTIASTTTVEYGSGGFLQVASGTDRILVVSVIWGKASGGPAPSIVSVKLNGLTMTEGITRSGGSTTNAKAAMYYYLSPTVQVENEVIITFDAAVDTECFSHAAVYQNVDQAAAIFATATAGAGTVGIAGSVASETGMLVVDCHCCWVDGAFASSTDDSTAGTDQTAYTAPDNSTVRKGRTSRKTATATSTSMSWTAPAVSGSPSIKHVLAMMTLKGNAAAGRSAVVT